MRDVLQHLLPREIEFLFAISARILYCSYKYKEDSKGHLCGGCYSGSVSECRILSLGERPNDFLERFVVLGKEYNSYNNQQNTSQYRN